MRQEETYKRRPSLQVLAFDTTIDINAPRSPLTQPCFERYPTGQEDGEVTVN